MILSLVDETVSSGARLNKACEVIGIPPRTIQRWRLQGGGHDRRYGPMSKPANSLSEEERQRVLHTVNSVENRDLPPKQIVPKLADKGEYLCSESTMHRILHQEKQHSHRDKARPATHSKPREYVANGPNQVLSWDITYMRTPVRGMFFYLYMFLDIWSRKSMGWAVHEYECNELAAQLLLQICQEHGLEAQEGVVLHSDNGAAMTGSTMLMTMKDLGVTASFSRPSVSDDNPYSESLFRTVKYRPSYPIRSFKNVEDARDWMARFARWYNTEHMHSSIGFVTPDDRHYGRDVEILRKRSELYALARQMHPERWTGEPRQWHRPRVVMLNPSRATRVRLQQESQVA
jgi:transposase InsO family protein